MKSPAFQFYPTDWLGSQRVQMLTLEEEGAYIRLVSSCWQHGSIPADPEQCARIVGKGCSTTVARVVQAMFIESPEPGRLVHERLEAERIKQECWREKSSLGGKKSAELRRISRVVEPPCKQDATNQMATLQSSSSSSSSMIVADEPPRASKLKFKAPTLDEVLLLAGKSGVSAVEAEKFFNYYESNGWRVGKNPMKNWHGAFSNWKLNITNYGHKQNTGRNPAQRVDRSIGTANEGTAHLYAGMGRVVKTPDVQRPGVGGNGQGGGGSLPGL